METVTMYMQDKNGKMLSYGDVVWIEVFEPKFEHSGVKRVLGKIIADREYDTWGKSEL